MGYVAPTGVDIGNTCDYAGQPCKTIKWTIGRVAAGTLIVSSQ
jgi:hypothetical protein